MKTTALNSKNITNQITKKQEKTTKSTSVKNTSTKKVEKETEEMADGKPGRPKKPVFDDVIQIADDNEFIEFEISCD